jgi:2,4-dienoyl-CoA reductase-like NADH-dependent reductase (Old Yellow Enzyme family)
VTGRADTRGFSPVRLGRLSVPNRIVRSATYEGLAQPDGTPDTDALAERYLELVRGGAGALITGFAFVSPAGRAMHPRQCGIHNDSLIPVWRRVTTAVKTASPGTRLVLQIAHCGRQTRRRVTGHAVLGASSRRCSYFREPVTTLTRSGVRDVIEQFADGAERARDAGFDAVQLHAAHGYLLHQFLSPWTNTRTDEWGNRERLLNAVVSQVRHRCGDRFPILVKLSWSEDRRPGITLDDTIETTRHLKALGVDAVEVSYGTMEYAPNIFRGACPLEAVLRVNPLFARVPRLLRPLWRRLAAPRYLARLHPFTEGYNLDAARRIRKETGIPTIATGGLDNGRLIRDALAPGGVDAVGLCRALIHDPAFPRKLQADPELRSGCVHCNLCAVYVDAGVPTQCHRRLAHDFGR